MRSTKKSKSSFGNLHLLTFWGGGGRTDRQEERECCVGTEMRMAVPFDSQLQMRLSDCQVVRGPIFTRAIMISTHRETKNKQSSNTVCRAVDERVCKLCTLPSLILSPAHPRSSRIQKKKKAANELRTTRQLIAQQPPPPVHGQENKRSDAGCARMGTCVGPPSSPTMRACVVRSGTNQSVEVYNVENLHSRPPDPREINFSGEDGDANYKKSNRAVYI